MDHNIVSRKSAHICDRLSWRRRKRHQRTFIKGHGNQADVIPPKNVDDISDAHVGYKDQTKIILFYQPSYETIYSMPQRAGPAVKYFFFFVDMEHQQMGRGNLMLKIISRVSIAINFLNKFAPA